MAWTSAEATQGALEALLPYAEKTNLLPALALPAAAPRNMAPLALPCCPGLLSSSLARRSGGGPSACRREAAHALAGPPQSPGVPPASPAPRSRLRPPAPSWHGRADMALCRALPRSADFARSTRRRVSCRAGDEDPTGSNSGSGSSSGSAESLFARELRKRGLASGSGQARTGDAVAGPGAAAEGARTATGDAASAGPSSGSPPSGGAGTAGAEWAEGQRERSSALNSEGLEGLPTRAVALVKLGASFYFSLWPLALLLVGAFLTLYLAWGADFIHAGKPSTVTAPAYIDPYELLRKEEELLPMVPFRPPSDRPL